MPCDCHLSTVNPLVSGARIMWVGEETKRPRLTLQLAIEEEVSAETTVYRFLETHI